MYNQPPSSTDTLFSARLLMWMPRKLLQIVLTCPEPNCNGTMPSAGLYPYTRQVIGIDSFYTFATEYLVQELS